MCASVTCRGGEIHVPKDGAFPTSMGATSTHASQKEGPARSPHLTDSLTSIRAPTVQVAGLGGIARPQLAPQIAASTVAASPPRHANVIVATKGSSATSIAVAVVTVSAHQQARLGVAPATLAINWLAVAAHQVANAQLALRQTYAAAPRSVCMARAGMVNASAGTASVVHCARI